LLGRTGCAQAGRGIISNPGDFAQYAVAFIVDEWRGGVKMSSTLRDFAIIVMPPKKPEPELRLDNATAAGFHADRLVRVEPGKPLSFSVLFKASDAGRDSLLPVSATFLTARKASAMGT
jgi:hypothetical protein